MRMEWDIEQPVHKRDMRIKRSHAQDLTILAKPSFHLPETPPDATKSLISHARKFPSDVG